ncbi:MAG: C_GCAxxG_C_C family protein [Lachnospiraceae bacterium]|nr:C_GCAxxG_C_C family protein [Lachnospiraceae bacterium]
MNFQEAADRAVELKRSGQCNCAQAVAVALAEEAGLDEETLKKLTSGFCVGMGTMKTTCGALIGANMVAGMKLQGNGTVIYSKLMCADFEQACGAVTCKDLKGINTGVVLCPCDTCVRNAVLSYAKIIAKQ